MADFSFITPRLGTGRSITGAADIEQLVGAGFTHCIDLRAEFDDTPLFVGSQLSYLYNGVPDDGATKPPSWFGKSIDYALAAISKPRCKVYCHCLQGNNRGPSTVYAILRALGWTREAAKDLINKNRPSGIRYMDDADIAVKLLGYE